MIEGNAVKQITELAIVAHSVMDSEKISAIALPKDVSVRSLEGLQDKPTRRRGSFTTAAIEQFAAYTKQHAIPGASATFIDPDSMSATMRVDHGNGVCGWGSHSATLQLEKSPEMAALNTICAQGGLTQDAMTDFIKDWRPSLKFGTVADEAGGGGLTDMSSSNAYQRIRNIKSEQRVDASHSEGDTGASKSVTESNKVTSAPPTVMIMTCCPFDGLRDREILVWLTYRTNGARPVISARIASQQALIKSCSNEFMDILQEHEHLTDNTYIGRYTDANAAIA